MSETYSITCQDCKRELWIAQSNTFYSGEPHTMEALKDFFFEHTNHNLKFVNDQDLDEDEYTEIDANDYYDYKENNPSP